MERRADEVTTHFLAMDPVTVAAILGAQTGPGAMALKKALACHLADETLSRVRAQSKGKGIAPGRQYGLQARERLRLRVREEANPTVSKRLKLRTKAAACKWAER